MIEQYPYPTKRYGNEKNPKLVILLENSGADPNHIKWNPEYVMAQDGVYKDAGMTFSVLKEYIKWWHDLSELWKEKFSDEDVLVLEYYPYPTDRNNKRKEIYPTKNEQQWNKYAKQALKENVTLLKKAMSKKVPIFVYYQAGWLEEVPDLKSYHGEISHIDRKRWRPAGIKTRFREFLEEL